MKNTTNTTTSNNTEEIEFNPGKIITIVIAVIFGVVIVFLLIGSIYTVNAGERVIVLRWGEPLKSPMSEGLHFKIPIADEIVRIDIKTQKFETDADAASKDLQTVHTKIAVNFHLTSDGVVELYKNIGISYNERVIQPAIQEVVKASTAQFTAEESITRRSEVKDKISKMLHDRLEARGIYIEDVSITNFEFSPSFNAAIEAKVTAEQNALAEKNKLAMVEYQAQQRIAQAEGEAKAIEIQANAIRSQGGQEYVQLQAINRWDGKMPTILMGSNGATPFIDVSKVMQ